MIRVTLFASCLILGAAATSGAQAFDHGARLASAVSIYAPRTDNVVGGAHAAIAGGGDNMGYQAADDARSQEAAGVGRMVGGGEGALVVYERAAPSTVHVADALGGRSPSR